MPCNQRLLKFSLYILIPRYLHEAIKMFYFVKQHLVNNLCPMKVFHEIPITIFIFFPLSLSLSLSPHTRTHTLLILLQSRALTIHNGKVSSSISMKGDFWVPFNRSHMGTFCYSTSEKDFTFNKCCSPLSRLKECTKKIACCLYPQMKQPPWISKNNKETAFTRLPTRYDK